MGADDAGRATSARPEGLGIPTPERDQQENEARAMAQDELRITVLEDGTIRTETDSFSPANHQSAEEFLGEVTRQAGGPMQRQRRGKHHHHGHTHTHVHTKQS
jgi:hypothetical protein